MSLTVTCPHPRPHHTSGCSTVSFSVKLPRSCHGSSSISKLCPQAPALLCNTYLTVTALPCHKCPSISAENTSAGYGEEEEQEDATQEQGREEEREQDIGGLTDPGQARSGEIRRFPLERSRLSLDPPTAGTPARSLDAIESEKLNSIRKWEVKREIPKGQGRGGGGGCILVRALQPEQMGGVEDLLTDSYAELMWGPLTYRPALAWILSSYLRERQACLPHAVTLVALFSPFESQGSAKATENDGYDNGVNVVAGVGIGDGNGASIGVSDGDGSGDGDAESQTWFLVGAVEISFNALGKPKDMQTPLPPIDAPFLSNMAVNKKFRRRGIGRELLRAAEELAIEMGCSEMYLHCRMIDSAPLTLYQKCGYQILETDNILSLLAFQRRRHLMRKTLAASSSSYSENPL